jgi:hypothetical protein
MKDALGQRGEWVFNLLITEFHSVVPFLNRSF